MNNILDMFFNRTYEENINKKLLFYDYSFPKDEVISYIDKIVDVKLDDYMAYINSHELTDAISSKDVFQFSNINDGTRNICDRLKRIDNPGVTYIEAGKLLHNDSVKRNDTAETKYGENHLKTGELLGLLFSLSNTYFLSCLGMVYSELDTDVQEKLLVRLILRSKLIYRLIRATNNGRVNLRQFLFMLSDSTFIRRRSNLKKLMSILKLSDEYDFSDLIEKIEIQNEQKSEYAYDPNIYNLKVAQKND